MTASKKIYDYNNYYVFNDGSIYNKARKAFLKPIKNMSGYCYITLSKNKNKQNCYIHRIVADHFLNKNTEQLQVNHKNRIKTDNRLSNLEWITPSNNTKHAHMTKSLVPSQETDGDS